MTIQKTWPQMEAPGFSLSGLITRLCKAATNGIPVGYQDESGFHYGAQPTRSIVKSTSVS